MILDFSRTPEDALAWFKSKGYQITWGWRDMADGAHARAFTVAGVMKLDVLQDIRGELTRALEQGTTYADFKRRLVPILQAKGWWGRNAQTDPETGEMFGKGLTPRRLETIFRANIQSAYMAGRYKQQMQMAELRPWWQYVAVMDSRTRPQHAALNGRIYRYDDPFWQHFYPPLGFNCFPADTLIRARASLGLKTLYAGKMVELHTRLGHRLTVTANHPVLTGRGWLPAHLVKEGDQTLGDAGVVDSSVVGVVDDEQSPTLAQDLFETLAAQGLRVVPMAAHDFHADAYLRKPEIEIAGADRHLMNERHATAQQFVGQGQLSATDAGRLMHADLSGRAAQSRGVIVNPMFAQNAADIAGTGRQLPGDGSLRDQAGPVKREDAPLNVGVFGIGGRPGSAALPRDGFRIGLHDSPLGSLRLGSVPHSDAALSEQPVEDVPTAPGLLRKLLEANPSAIALDEVVDVRQFDWSGHVYDFETNTGLMIAGGIVVHNCRCRTRAWSEDEIQARGLDTSVSGKSMQRVWVEDPYRPGQQIDRWRLEYAPGKFIAPDIGWDGNPGEMGLWDRAATLPDCSWGSGDVAALAAAPAGACLRMVAGQKSWRDFGRPDLRDVPQELRLPSPGMLARAASRELAVETLAAELGLTAEASRRVIRTPVESLVIWRDVLPHMVEKESDARERYARFVLPTLLDPFEVYLTQYDDGRVRPRYIGLFQGERDLMCIVRRNRDGSFLWNLMQARDKDMNVHRVGDLVYGK